MLKTYMCEWAHTYFIIGRSIFTLLYKNVLTHPISANLTKIIIETAVAQTFI